MNILWIYLVVINMIGFIAMGVDKEKAKAGAWRIPEKVLLGIAVIGGSVGVWAGMEIFHHKTKHWYFKKGLPIIFLAQLTLYYSF